MSKQEEIIEVCGKKVVVRYARTQEDACASCAFCSRKECHDLDCNMRDIIGEGVCRYAYFVEAERQVPADVQEAADKAAEKAAYKYYPNSPSSGQFGTGDYQPEEDNSLDREVFVKGFKAGIAWERERLMKEAVEVNVSNVGILQMGSILTDRGIGADQTIKLIILK